MDIRPITTAEEESYRFVENLLTEAFPAHERRDLSQQRFHTDCHPLFKCHVIEEAGIPIGLLTFWDFAEFGYIEHFAIKSELRNHRYGERALKLLQWRIKKPIVVEVEHPDDETAERRIRFYERAGFRLWPFDYSQPPYREGDAPYPMRLMEYGDIAMETRYEAIKKRLYKEVYYVEIPPQE